MLELLVSYIGLTNSQNICSNWYFTNEAKYEKYECYKLDTENIILNVKKGKNTNY